MTGLDPWEWRTVAELASDELRAITDGPFGSNLKTSHYTDAGPRVIRLQNIGHWEFLDAEAHISTEHYERLRAHEALAGDVVVASLGDELPRACVVPRGLGPAIVKADCHRIRVGPHIRPEFLAAALNSSIVRRQAAALISGIGRPRLNLRKLKSLRIPTPPLGEQDRIVEALEGLFVQLDRGVESLTHARDRVISQREASYTAALQGPWPTVGFGELLREPLRNGHSAKTAKNGSGIRTLTLTAVTRGEFTDSNTKLADAEPARVKDLWIQPGDIFVERSNTAELVGTAALYKGEPDWAIFPDLLIRARVTDAALPEFVALVLKERAARRYFQRAAQGIAGTMPKISQEAIRALPVPLPDIEEQRRIVARVDAEGTALKQAEGDMENSASLEGELRRAILRSAFIGRLVPRNPEEEPASSLLKRAAEASSVGGAA